MTSSSATENASASAPRDFRTTHWSTVLAAGDTKSSEAAAALQTLCYNYWYPLYVFVRRSGYSPADAEDLTQSFFHRLLSRHYLSLADPAKGRFRSFLLCALKRFLADEWDKSHAQKRGGHLRVVPLHPAEAEDLFLMEPADTRTPEAIYDRRWAHSILDEVLRRLNAEYELDDKGPLFAKLKVFLVGEKGELSFADAAKDLGLTESAVKSIVHRMRARYCELVRQIVAETVQNPSEVDAEIRHLMQSLCS